LILFAFCLPAGVCNKTFLS